jgi:hypothetical protein
MKSLYQLLDQENNVLPFKSLDAATTVGPGEIRDLEGAFTKHTIEVIVTGNPVVEVKLHVSLDGQIWKVLGSTITKTDHETVQSGPWRYVRANLNSISGGTDPTVTAWVLSAP